GPGASMPGHAATCTVALSHAHFDHVLGTAALPAGEVLAHPSCAGELAGLGHQRRRWEAHYRQIGERAQAERLASARFVAPTRTVTHEVLDLGGRRVTLAHRGLGHTRGDLLLHVPDADVVFAGDLVEQGAEPQVGPDAVLADWPATLDALLAWYPQTVVPGHGEPVNTDFVRAQRDSLAAAYRARPTP
ncbi:MAG: MBL fold metallo-hydrolase, partial [Sciscionella sp.]